MIKYRYDIYQHLMRKYIGLQGISVKLPIRDVKALSLVSSPGVKSSCREIQKDIDNSFKYTNKLNSMLLVTDSSGGNFNRPEWNDKAPIPYLEGISSIYKKLANIDSYPLIIKQKEIKNGKELEELITKVMPAFSAVEFYNMHPDLIQEYNHFRDKRVEQLHEKHKYNDNNCLSYFFASLSSINKHAVQQEFDEKNFPVNINLIYAAAIRVSLDTQSYINLNELVEELKNYALVNFVDVSRTRVYSTMTKLIKLAYDYLDKKGCIFPDVDKYYVDKSYMCKESIVTKYKKFITEGENGWVCDYPIDYVSTKNDIYGSSLIAHLRHKGVICTNTKIPFQSVEQMLELLHFHNFEKITQKIIVNPLVAKEMTSHGNLGAILTNGTSVLDLGNIGPLAGLPVAEGKSILFKLLGGVDMVPFCIDETDPEKFVRISELISPIFSIIDLEDIKSPECFYIEPKLNEKVDFPVFNDAQQGTAIATLAGVINSLKIANKEISQVKVVMNGAGASGLSVSELLVEYGIKNFIVCDNYGAIYSERKENMNEFKLRIAKQTNPNHISGKLEEVIKGADIFIGLSKEGILTTEMIKTMNTKPILFILANPTPEIHPAQAYEAGAFIFATGKRDLPNHINNSMAFPGMFRAALDLNTEHITNCMKIAAAEAIASSVKDHHLRVENILPSSMDTTVAMRVAKSVAKAAEKEGIIRRPEVNAESVEENIDAWFHEGELRVKF